MTDRCHDEPDPRAIEVIKLKAQVARLTEERDALGTRVRELALDVLELEARLRLAKSAAISAADVAQTALARLQQTAPIADLAVRNIWRLEDGGAYELVDLARAYQKIVGSRS